MDSMLNLGAYQLISKTFTVTVTFTITINCSYNIAHPITSLFYKMLFPDQQI